MTEAQAERMLAWAAEGRRCPLQGAWPSGDEKPGTVTSFAQM